MVNKIDSNVTGLAIAEETTPGVLPGSPVWYEAEPNSYQEFGGQIETVARDTLNATRQRLKGSTTDLNVSAGFNTDLTQHNLTRIQQGFVFADAHEKPDTASFNSTAITISAVDGTNDQFEAASGLDAFLSGSLVFSQGFTNTINNGLHVVDGVAAGAIDVTTNLVTETPPAGARVQAVGFQFASADAVMTVSGGVATLSCTAADFTDMGLTIGEWVWLGGDDSGDAFATCPRGFARIETIAATALRFDKVTSAFVSDTGTGKTLQMFFGKFLRNEPDADDIVTRSYQLERTLGRDANGVQSQYIEAAFCNTLTLNIPTANKATVDLGFVGLDDVYRDGTTGVKSGDRVAALGEDAFNTSSKVYRLRMNIIDPATLQPTALFGYVTDANITISNNVSAIKAVGNLGGIDVSVGNFDVGGTITALFTEISACDAIRNNPDVTFDVILAQENAGLIYDIPLTALGNGRLDVVKDQPIKLPISMLAAKGAAGYTLGIVNFPYLPDAAMPS